MNRTKQILASVVVGLVVLGVVKIIPRTKDVYLIGVVDFKMVRNLVKDLQPTWFDYINNIDVLNIHINSPGGYAAEGLGIVDILNNVNIPVKNYIAEGFACSAGALILASGSKHHRFATKNCMIMIHYAYSLNPITGEKNPDNDSSRILNKMIEKIIVDATGKKINVVKIILSFDNFMTPEQAKELGLIDNIIGQDNDHIFTPAPLNPEFIEYSKTK